MTSAAPIPPSLFARRWRFLLLEYTAALGVTYWTNFIWYYLDHIWHPEPSTSLLINAGFGFFYVLGCLSLPRIARSLSIRGMLVIGYLALMGITVASGMADSLHAQIAIMFMHAVVVTLTWPNLETLAAGGLHGEDLGRMVSLYNIGWAGTSALTVAISGWFYDHVSPLTPFVIPCFLMACALLLVLKVVPASGIKPGPSSDAHADEDDPLARVDPALASAMRQLSRVGNMGSYLMLSVLIPIMPMICRDLHFGIAGATAFASVWLIVRVATFIILGHWHGWHFRVDYFLAAAGALPFCFAVILYSGSPWIVFAAQVVMGFAIGLVYTSALFYSLHGETTADQAATHEAVIGLGIMSGPLVGGLVALGCAHFGYDEKLPVCVIIFSILASMVVWMLLRGARILRAH